MSHVASFARLGLFTTVALVLASACGGQSFTGGDGGDAGSNSSGSSAGGSTGNHAGTSSTAGKGHAGTGTTVGGTTSSAGTSFGGSGSAGTPGGGTGGGLSEACGAPANSGSCDAYIPSWYNDASTGICRPFIYGGCDGNANRYASLQECQNACPGGTPNYDACKLPSDCMVTGTGCCGICDSANITVNDLIAYNKQYAGQLQCGLALDMAAGGSSSAGAAAPIACAPCPAPQPGQGTLKYFVPNCVAGQCVVEDLRTSPVTACRTSSECKLRNGTACCEGCGGGETFSVRNDGSFEKLVCGGGAVACPACVPGAPSGVPYCANGRCSVAIAADAG